MNSTNKVITERIGRYGLLQLTMDEIFKSGSLIEVLTEKVNTLNPANLTEHELEKRVQLLIEVLRESIARRYTGLSLLAFAHILIALDHFIRVTDPIPDTQVGGYKDDLVAVNQVVQDFRTEFDAFHAWQHRTGAHE